MCDPTLIRVAEDWLTYHESGAYVLIENGTMQAEISKFLVGAQVVAFDAKENKMINAPFNPKSADVMEVYNALARLCHRELADFKPPCWLDRRAGPIRATSLLAKMACSMSAREFCTRTHPTFSREARSMSSTTHSRVSPNSFCASCPTSRPAGNRSLT